MNKIIIIVLLLFLVVAAFFFATRSNEQMEMPGKISSEVNQLGGSNASNNTEQSSQLPETGVVEINTQSSTLGWNAKKIIGNPNHNGTVDIKGGNFRVSDGVVVGGDFVVDMTSLQVSDEAGGERLESHLKSADFFNVEQYPDASLSIIRLEKAENGENNLNVAANLTIKGRTNEIMFPVKLVMDGNKISADASFSINRTRWDIIYGSGSFFDNLGDQAIDDMINFDIHVET